MNSLQDILYSMSKCVNFVNSSQYLKEYLTKRSFIIMFWKALNNNYKNMQ